MPNKSPRKTCKKPVKAKIACTSGILSNEQALYKYKNQKGFEGDFENDLKEGQNKIQKRFKKGLTYGNPHAILKPSKGERLT